MPDDKKENDLFEEFQPVSLEEWEKVLERDLKEENYKEKLRWDSLEGVEALPFYRKEDLESVDLYRNNLLPDTPSKWHFCETIFATDPEEANRCAKLAVENGAGAIRFEMDVSADVSALGSDLTGTAIQSIDDLKTLLNGIDIKKTAIFFDAGIISPALIAMLNCCAEEDEDYSYMQLSKESKDDDDDNEDEEDNGSPIHRVSQDPFRYYMLHGRSPADDEMVNALIRNSAGAPGFLALSADGTLAYNSGATLVQSLGIALAAGSEFLARVPENERNKTAAKIWMRLPVGSLYFPEIAKFRAARLLWQRVLDGYEIEKRKPLFIQAESVRWNKSAADPHNNILRATTEAMAAIIGGADSIMAEPFDAVYKQPDDFSARIARNISHILENESHLDKTANPADGSWYIEKLTDQIAEKAWEFFRMIEKQGGLVKAIESRMIQTEIERSAAAKKEALATRKLILAGVNNYPNSEEKLPEPLKRSRKTVSLNQTLVQHSFSGNGMIPEMENAIKKGALLGDLVSGILKPQKQLYSALAPYRAAEPFEQLRLDTHKLAGKRGRDISAQLVPVGNKKWRKARAEFSKNFLECGGFVVNSSGGWDKAEDALKELEENQPDMIVLCGADEEYPDWIKPVIDRLTLKSKITILAGRPGGNEEKFRNVGIDHFIYKGVNMIDVLKEIQSDFGAIATEETDK